MVTNVGNGMHLGVYRLVNRPMGSGKVDMDFGAAALRQTKANLLNADKNR